MAITTIDQLMGSAKQYQSMVKTVARTSVAAQWTSLFDLAGNPSGGVLAGTSTTAGVVPTDATPGTLIINAFGGGNTGYLAQVDYGASVACRLRIYDLLWKGGAYAFNANTSGNTPTSFSSRVPGGTDFSDTQLWYEQVTAGTGVQNVNVTYNDENGVSSTTGTVAAPAAMILGRMFQIGLAAGDRGVQGVTGVVGTVATVGTFNILVMRPVWSGRVKIANDGDVHDWTETGMPIIFENSALVLTSAPDSTSTGIPEVELVIVNG